MKKYISVLLAVMAFIFGMTTRNVFAADPVIHKVTDFDGTVTVMELPGLDFQSYAKYNKDIQAVKKDLVPASSLSSQIIAKSKPQRILAKAKPGATIRVRAVESSFKNGVPCLYFGRRTFTIAGSSISLITKDDGHYNFLPISPPYNGRPAEGFKLVIPKNADMVCAHWRNAPMFHKKADSEKYKNVNNFVRTEYYIFTSDEAFKKAYKIWTGKTITGPIGSAPATKKEPAKTTTNKNKNQSKTTVQPQKSDDEGGIGTIGKIGIGLGAAGAIGLGISQLMGGGGAGAGSGSAAETAPSEPESFVYTDPATGAQTLYEKDPNTGEWYDPSTGAITDPTKLEEYSEQRKKDRAWMDDQMDNMRKGKTDIDRAWREQDQKAAKEMQKRFEEIDRQGAKDKAAIRSGTYRMTDAERTDFLNKRQEDLVSKQTAAHQTAKNWDRAVKAAEVTQKVADLTVDGLSVATGPAGKMIANVYTGAKNIVGETTEAVVNGKSVVGGITKGIAKGGADIVQNLAGDSQMKWLKKAGTYVVSEAGKEVVVAAIDGESKAAALTKGLVNGGCKIVVDTIGDNISGGAAQQNWNVAKQEYKKINRVWNKDLSQKSVNMLTEMNFKRYAGKELNRELAQGFGQTLTKEFGATSYDVIGEGKSVTESMFGEKW